jgi:hypothetical protein
MDKSDEYEPSQPSVKEPGRESMPSAVSESLSVGTPPLQETRSTERWERLLLRERIAGFRRRLGGMTMYSKDGYGWNATPIEYDAVQFEASFRGPSLRVFHGDIVEMPYRYDAQEHRELVVLVPRPGEDCLFDSKAGEAERLSALWPPPNQPFAQRRQGYAWEAANLRDTMLGVVEALEAEKRPPLTMVAHAAGILLLGVVLAGWLQWVLLGEVGAITALLGGFITVLIQLARWRRINPYLFSRRWALVMTARIALLSAASVSVSGVLMGLSTGQVAGMGAAGLLFSGLVWLLSADIVAWRTGGYCREKRRSSRPGARWD